MLLTIITIILISLINFSWSQFNIPEVTMEAYSPQGFKASIPAINGIKLVAYHLNVNKEISNVEPGDYSSEILSPINNLWSYFNSNLTLKIGDTIYYWIFVQHENHGYRKIDQQFEITELIKLNNDQCGHTSTIVNNKIKVCSGDLLFEDNFREFNILPKKWLIEQFIPANGPDFEFVSYQKGSDVCFIEKTKHYLFLKPKVAENEDDLRGELNFQNSCTKNSDTECSVIAQGIFILPPIASSRILSVIRFRYGIIEIKAKLPKGDWLYPQIYLERISNPEEKLLIAYARGNEELIGNNNDDIGGKLLFGGPILNSSEPQRSKYLRSKRNSLPFSNSMHIYKLKWSKDEIILWCDDIEYGRINKSEMDKINFAKNDLVRLVLGVGVGGINDFPDGYKTSNKQSKPWRNKERNQVKQFFSSRHSWLKTWINNNIALEVDYVKIWSL